MTHRTYRRVKAAACHLILAASLASCGAPGAARTPDLANGRVIPAQDATDGFVVTFASEPNPPAKGDNAILVTVKRADGSPLTDGAVTMVFSMPAMPSMNMPAMRTDSPLPRDREGLYRGNIPLSMGGTWNVTITVTREGRTLATRRTSIVAKE